MRVAGLHGVSRRMPVRTTVRDETARPAPDLLTWIHGQPDARSAGIHLFKGHYTVARYLSSAERKKILLEGQRDDVVTRVLRLREHNRSFAIGAAQREALLRGGSKISATLSVLAASVLTRDPMTKSRDAREDLIGGFRPDERLRGRIAHGDGGDDCRLKDARAAQVVSIISESGH
jgi:hypothetical protein